MIGRAIVRSREAMLKKGAVAFRTDRKTNE